MKVYLDSNVLIDFYSDRIPFNKNSERILSQLYKYEVYSTIANVIFVDYYAKDKTREDLKDFLKLINLVNLDNRILENALNLRIKDIEDALQIASCQTVADIFVTRDKKLLKIASTYFNSFTPEELLKYT